MGSRQSCTWWSLAKQRKQPEREAGRVTVITCACFGGAAEVTACRYERGSETLAAFKAGATLATAAEPGTRPVAAATARGRGREWGRVRAGEERRSWGTFPKRILGMAGGDGRALSPRSTVITSLVPGQLAG